MIVTPLYAGLLALWFLVLSIWVIQGRSGPEGPSLGDGGDVAMARRIRGHANFAEYVPLVLVLMGVAELSAAPAWMLHGVGLCLFVGRLLHGYALSFSANNPLGRILGMVLTFAALLLTAGYNLGYGLTRLLP
ncbi:MAG: MAPEG family protein [Abyssibacter sp.]